MTDLTHVESLVINETSDDAENLEQIYWSLMPQAVSLSCAESPSATDACPGTATQVTLVEVKTLRPVAKE